jgi:glycosyltransferase involved in cell wall biosynthesis
MAERTLSGMQQAAAVVCDSGPVRDELLARGLIANDRLHVVPLAVRPECSPEPLPSADAEAERLLGPAREDAPELLHVGSNVPRKRVDVLLQVFANIQRRLAAARLIKVGGALEGELARQASELGIAGAITAVPFIAPEVLAAIYRRAALVLQPSDLEGFGLPVVEALACGTPVLASDIAVLREVGSEAANYAPVGDVEAWSDAALKLLIERGEDHGAWAARRARAIAHAAEFRWPAHAKRLVEIYRAVLN